jgi:hypothetical protein
MRSAKGKCLSLQHLPGQQYLESVRDWEVEFAVGQLGTKSVCDDPLVVYLGS